MMLFSDLEKIAWADMTRMAESCWHCPNVSADRKEKEKYVDHEHFVVVLCWSAATATAAANKHLQKNTLKEKDDQERVKVARDVYRVRRLCKLRGNRRIRRRKDLKYTQRVIRALDGYALRKISVEGVDTEQDSEEQSFDEQKQVDQNP